MARKPGIVKKISLAKLAEGWGDECYILTTPLNYPQMVEVRKMKSDQSEEEMVNFMLKLIHDNLLGGKIKVYEDNDLKLVDVTVEDIANLSVEMVDAIFAGMTGVKYADPKASVPVAENVNSQPVLEEHTEI
ncbi:hypothetical protein [Streptomyces sp. NPDC056401]|uniref:hypothetical protein n=1 Tax=Streptomyces sp. NPDC056401 TaxID=3345809 RepID=UPI0035D879B9